MIYLLSLLLAGAPALAGNDQGHGGTSVVCRDPGTGAIQRAELFDLWEGAEARPAGHSLRIVRNATDVDSQVSDALAKLRRGNPSFADQVRVALAQVRRDLFILRDGNLADTSDVDPLSLPSDPRCLMEQLGVYEDDDVERKRLLIQQEIFSALASPTDQGAFFLHEAIFKVFRQAYALYEYRRALDGRRTNIGQTSRPTRELVATLFSTEELRPVPPASPADLHCEGEYFEFFRHDDVLEFVRLGAPLFSRALVWIPGAAADIVPEIQAAPIASAFTVLGHGARFQLSQISPTEFLAASTGGQLQIPAERVTCSRP